VHDVGDAVVAQDRGDQFAVGDVALHERRIDHRIGVAEFERVEHHHVTARRPQRSNGVRADVPGAAGDENSVASDAIRCQLEGCATGESSERTLGDCVHRDVHGRRHCVDGADVDDGAACSLQRRMERPNHLERRPNVRVHDQFPVGVRSLDERPVHLERCIVDEGIEGFEPFEMRQNGRDPVTVRQVGSHEVVDDQVLDGVSPVDSDHAPASSGERFGGCPPDSSAGARDDDGLHSGEPSSASMRLAIATPCTRADASSVLLAL
jgi:hypothetical protein